MLVLFSMFASRNILNSRTYSLGENFWMGKVHGYSSHFEPPIFYFSRQFLLMTRDRPDFDEYGENTRVESF